MADYQFVVLCGKKNLERYCVFYVIFDLGGWASNEVFQYNFIVVEASDKFDPNILRDGQWQEQDTTILVPGDIVSIKLGDITLAYARLLEGDSLKFDQSALTGEFLLVNNRTVVKVYFDSTYKHGEIEAVVKLAIGSHQLSQQDAITKKMTVTEVLVTDKTGTLTLNCLTVNRNLIEGFNKDMGRDMIVLLAARASKMENQDAIVAAIINMLVDPNEVIGNVRTVQAFAGEEKAVSSFIEVLRNTYECGRKAGLAKVLGLGTLYLDLFLSWTLLLWYTSIVVLQNIADGGKVFTTMLNVVISDLSLEHLHPNVSHRLICSYLLHDGCKETFNAFDAASKNISVLHL